MTKFEKRLKQATTERWKDKDTREAFCSGAKWMKKEIKPLIEALEFYAHNWDEQMPKESVGFEIKTFGHRAVAALSRFRDVTGE